jgi:cell volume regulation protein A
VVETGFILVAGILVLGSLALTLLTDRVRLPALIVFIGVGMLIGSDGLNLVPFSDFELAQMIGIVALALIIFEGGLSAGFGTIRPVLAPSLSLATVGTVLTALITGFAAYLLLDLSLLEGFLLGSILASTDAAAVFSILRGSTLRRRVTATLEGEAGFNDPVAVVLVIGFISLIQNPGDSALEIVLLFVEAIGIGAVVGLVVGKAGLWLLERANFQSAGLYPVASIAIAAIAFGAAQEIHGSGFLAVYLVGLALAAPSDPALRTIESFHGGLAWVAQVGMFLMLGLLVFPDELPAVALEGLAIGLVVAFLARPVAAWIATIGQGFAVADRLTIGWAGLRGAVPIVLATFPVVEGVVGGGEMFNIVFFAVVISALFQGMTISPVARWLGATTDESAIPTPLVPSATIHRLGAETVEFPVRKGDAIVGLKVRDLHITKDALLTLVLRDDRAILPRGDTDIQAGDLLELIVRQEGASDLRRQMREWRRGDPERRS